MSNIGEHAYTVERAVAAIDMPSCYVVRTGHFVAIADIVQHATGSYEVTRINVPRTYYRQGIGTAIMRAICDDADKHDVTLLVAPLPYDETYISREALIEFYKSFGFSFYLVPRTPYMVRLANMED